MMSIATYEASVMIGERNSQAAELRSLNSKMISFHCVCNRLALFCVDDNDDASCMSVVEIILRQLWKSLKKLTEELYKSIAQITVPVKKVLRKVRMLCRTRWLSLDCSVQAVYLEFILLIQTLQHFSEADAITAGLLSQMRTPKLLVLFPF